MATALGIFGRLFFTVGLICTIIFGIILLIKALKKRSKKSMVISTSISGGIIILGIIFMIISSSLNPTGSGLITHKQYKSVHEDDTKNEVLDKLGKPFSKDKSIDEWVYKFSDKPDVGEKVTLDFDGNDLIIKETQKEYEKNVSDDNSNYDSGDYDSNQKSANISLSNAKTAAQLKKAAKKADSDDVKTAFIRDGIPVIQFKDEMESSEKTVVQNFALYSSDLLKKEKDNPNFNSFVFIRKTTFVDEKENEKNETAVLAYFTKKNAQSINYKNFHGIVDLDSYKFYNVSDGYFINPGIYSKIRDDFGGLSAYKNSPDRKVSDDFYNEISAGY